MGREKKSGAKQKSQKVQEAITETGNGSQTPKICTRCNRELPRTDFYSKGKRLDSWCMECKKEKRKAAYLSVKSTDAFSQLQKILELVFDVERRTLDKNENILLRIERNAERKTSGTI